MLVFITNWTPICCNCFRWTYWTWDYWTCIACVYTCAVFAYKSFSRYE